MRAALRLVFRLVLRIFFRRIEVSGADRVPRSGPVIFTLNHPNGLIDPAFLLCYAPRRASFLAKAPLFRMPVIGWFCRMLDAIPVYRRQDAGSDPAQNRATFEAARRVLSGEGAIAIFPEGASHSDPAMQRFKTGAARIALGAGAALGGTAPVAVVPAGIYYREKQTFRSEALLYFGTPFAVPPLAEPLAPGAEPPAGPVLELTGRIQQALADVTVQASRAEALALVARAQRIISVDDGAPGQAPRLSGELALRHRLADGHDPVRERWPERYSALASRITRYEATLAGAGIEPHHLQPGGYTLARLVRYVAQSAVVFLLLLPLAVIGGALHYPAYRLVGFVATGIAKGDEAELASVKVLAAMVMFPVTWGLAAAGAWLWRGPLWGAAVLVALPIAGFGALLFFERLDRLAGRARALLLLATRRRRFLRLVAERRAIRDEVIALGADLDQTAPASGPGSPP